MILSQLIFLPVIGAFLLLLIPTKRINLIKWGALLFSLIECYPAFQLLANFKTGIPTFQLMESYAWLPKWGISYILGVDGISIWLVMLTIFITPIVILSGWNSIKKAQKAFFILVLAMETPMLGSFLALDLVLFYIFFETTLIPMYFLIGIWGSEDRIYAAIKLMLFTLVGSLLMLVGIIYLGIKNNTAGYYAFSYINLTSGGLELTRNVQLMLMGAFGLAFAIKVPLFPLHTWLPDAHVQAPAGGSVVLAAILLKLGSYGFLRFCIPLFPLAVQVYIPYILIIGVIGIIYGAFMAYAQEDLKRLIAYSSVSHMGLIVVGIFALTTTAIQGSLYQMLNHGVSTGALFFLVGVIYTRRHTRMMADFGGLAHVTPWFATAFLIITLSSIGLPLTNGFIGEFLTLAGTFEANRIIAILSTTGVVLGAVYMLSMYQKVFYGTITHEENRTVADMNVSETVAIVALLVLVFVMGLFPNIFLERIAPSVDNLINGYKMVIGG
jgi:NADH-quinone oxidoreductase subunit M